MTSTLKNFYIAIAVMSMFAIAQVTGMECNPSPYCAPNMCDVEKGEMNVKGELLFWVPQLCGLESAFGDTTIATTVHGPIITTTVIESDKDPEFKWNTGFRVGLDESYRCYDFEGDWTHYHGSAKFDEDPQYGNWKLKYDTIDFTFARRCCVSPTFFFKPFIGVRGAIIHQHLTSHLETLSTAITGDSTIFTDKYDKERFWGVGPELGFDINWFLGCSFSLYGSVDVVAYYGKVKSSNFDTDTFTSTVSISDGEKKHCFNNFGTDAAIGIRWDKFWNCNGFDVIFMLKAGLEQHRLYEFSQLGSDGTLSLDGGVFAAGIGFRY